MVINGNRPENQIPGILGECGGGCSCATCHVYVETNETDKLSVVSEIEEETLEFVDNKIEGLSRLSCQIEITEELDGHVFSSSNRLIFRKTLSILGYLV